MRYILAWVFVCAASLAGAEGARITVQGVGSAEAIPDVAVITVGVEARAVDPQAAADAMAKDAAEVMAALVTQSVALIDIQTRSIDLQPIYETRGTNRRSVIVGFVASNRLSVTLRDLEQVGPVLSAVLAVGADRLEGLRFDISDPAPLQAQARQAAVEDARLRAETYAAAAGLTLGPVLLMQEGGADYGPRPEMMMSARMADMPVAAGSQSVGAQVTVTYALIQP